MSFAPFMIQVKAVMMAAAGGNDALAAVEICLAAERIISEFLLTKCLSLSTLPCDRDEH